MELLESYRKRRFSIGKVKGTLRDGEFSRERVTDAYRALIAGDRSLPLDDIIGKHRANILNGTDVLKLQHKTQLSAVGELCVKTYTYPKPGTSPYALREWKGSWLLLFNDIPAARPVAVVAWKDKTSALISELVRGTDLDRVLYHEYAGMEVKEKFAIARGLGRLIGTMHAGHIYHADLKSSNIKLFRNPPRFVLIDNGKVSRWLYLFGIKRMKNLVQVNISIPRHVSRSVRMAFLHAYAETTGEAPKELFRKAWRLSAPRTVTYCTNDGNRSDKW